MYFKYNRPCLALNGEYDYISCRYCIIIQNVKMVKTTFLQRSEKFLKYIEFGYHLHKSTFKGLSSVFKEYNDIEQQYSTRLLKLGQSGEVEELHRQMPAVSNLVREFIKCIHVKSQLHFNYSERLREISAYYLGQYQTSKQLKDKVIRIVKDKNEEEYEKAKSKKDRDILNSQEKQILQNYYDHLHSYYDEEGQRTRKIKQQFIIYFSITKKTIEKEQQAVKGYSDKFNRFQLDIICNQIEDISKIIVEQYNGYNLQSTLKTKPFTKNQFFQDLKRSSIRQSMMLKERFLKVDDLTNKLKNTIETYEGLTQQLYISNVNPSRSGLFESLSIPDKGVYARQIKSDQLQLLFYQMMHRYWLGGQKDVKMLLQTIKSNLKILNCKPTKPNLNLKQFLQQQKNEQRTNNWIWQLNFLLYINAVMMQQNDIESLNKFMMKEIQVYKGPLPEYFAVPISIVGIDILLQSLIVLGQGQLQLYDNYIELFPIIYQFGANYLQISPKTTVILFLRKIIRFFKLTREDLIEEIQQILNFNFTSSELNQKQIQLRGTLTYQILNNLTGNLINFFSERIQLANTIKMLFILQKVGHFLTQDFSAIVHIHNTLKAAGYRYLQKADQDSSLEGSVLKGHQRLKNIVQILDQLDYNSILTQQFQPAADKLSKLLGVGRKPLQMKMLNQFMSPCMQIIESNIELVLSEKGINTQGHILRLGIFLGKVDKLNPRPISYYNNYIQALEEYLIEAEKYHNELLQKSRQTELWIMQQNSSATQNCIDFCSLLSKSFQFLLKSLKEIKGDDPTEFTTKYSQFVRMKLNNILKDQITKYINFLYDSLSSFNADQLELVLKPKRYQKIQKENDKRQNNEQWNRHKYKFKEVTRRMYNMQFLQEQLNQMISDFLDNDVYNELLDKELNNLSLDKVKKVASQSTGQTRQILVNIGSILQLVQNMQQKITRRVADITIYYFWTPIFAKLYYQQEKGAITQFFSSKDDYKLSLFTCLHFQQQIQQDLNLIGRNIPPKYIDFFGVRFLISLFYRLRFEVLNSTKFKMPIKNQQIVQYLEADLAYLATTLKKRFFNDIDVEKHLQVPIRKLLQDFSSLTNKLIGMFEEATVKNDKKICMYALVILNLRINDEKAQQFVKKYKNTLK